ncbi:UDP-N-acetylmuramoyl-L-alanyl-D-glutamate--2,6-diaminopimelate ligase [Alsobacter sp. SYSU M60028]|uniref:UDP-N-acetylmuramoyl-L-alanyl-D-glutamate--2,6-diaminopimelate ligase n=1 Tax=Alsobacter ponti TaxID=2962936 RepID=A0ABT1L8X0_9HYPH|nr:UDP-N-acetylmuramoyl-L-alanyl-D-glutamate--2,6-diaminopimelate ligase [Alsobacter ponti]MCP8937175.1 UDP-N-acetylmuramoyl-L-alanyl-D-glutamate--2,6-diaminopimelate ligase [Alsobacter ponti]
MILGELFPGEIGGPEAWIPVAGLTADSRAVGPGSVFFAVPGTRADGLAFAGAALAAGAVAVVAEAEKPADFPADKPFIRVRDVRRALALAAAAAHPAQPGVVAAVTGTSGKTSVADFTRQILAACGRQAASLGTIGVVAPSGAHYGTLTTPDPVTLHVMLETLAQDGVTHLAMEASSHGLDQRRLDGVKLAAGAFTNLGRDHLDYHPTVEDYLKAKLRLFDTLLPDDGVAVVNADGAHAREVIETVKARGLKLMTVGRAGKQLRLASLARDGFGQAMIVEAEGRRFDVHLPLAGEFQAANALVAAGLAIAVGEDMSRVLAALPKLAGVKGRLEKVGERNGAPVFVDYAHKPDALAQVLDTLRPYATGRLVCVFGCGGDRDRGKRFIMGQIAADKADAVIVTDDNPRSEDAASIRAAIMAGAPRAREIGDRALAIRSAIGELQPGDVLVVAGKGHETGQVVGDRTLPFSDHDAVAAALRDAGEAP